MTPLGVSTDADMGGGFLSNLTADEIATVLSYAQIRFYLEGELAVREGERDRSLYIVTAGSFEVLVVTGARAQRADIVQAGDMFGELAFFDNLPRSADVRALEESTALVITHAGFERLRLTHPGLAVSYLMELGRLLSFRFRNRARRLASLGQLAPR